MSRGASPKREREYEELNERFAKRGRYGKRGPQVAARIVNKQRAQYGETKGEKREEKENKSPDRNLPLDGYRHQTVSNLRPRLKSLSLGDLKKIRGYEQKHKNRKGAAKAIDAELDKRSRRGPLARSLFGPTNSSRLRYHYPSMAAAPRTACCPAPR